MRTMGESHTDSLTTSNPSSTPNTIHPSNTSNSNNKLETIGGTCSSWK